MVERIASGVPETEMSLKYDSFVSGEWRTPRTLSRVLSGMRRSYPSETIFCTPTLNRFHRELWAAVVFCNATSSRKVRMTTDDALASDFDVLQRDGTILPVQFTEAMMPGRRRGDQYKALAGRKEVVTPDPFDNWYFRRQHIPDALAKSINKKAEKDYASDTALPVYLNIGTYGV